MNHPGFSGGEFCQYRLLLGVPLTVVLFDLDRVRYLIEECR